MSNFVKRLFKGNSARNTEIIALMSGRSEESEIDLMSRVFDKVLLYLSDQDVSEPKRSSDRVNVFPFIFKSTVGHIKPFSDVGVGAHTARWLAFESFELIIIMGVADTNLSVASTPTDNDNFMVIGNRSQNFESLDSIELPTEFKERGNGEAKQGMILDGLSKPFMSRNAMAEFILIKNCHTLRDAIAGAARRGILESLYDVRTGLESY